MEKLRYYCDDRGPFFSYHSDVSCELNLGDEPLGEFTVSIDMQEPRERPYDFSIDIDPSPALLRNLRESNIDEDDFKDAMESEFKDIRGVIGVELKDYEGVLDT